jgi:membrane dipeptidase
MLITSQSDLTDCLNIRRSNSSPVGGFIRTEGSNRLAGNRSDIKYLFGLSVQIMSLHHFFDNDLGGSLHGKSRSGLTIFGHLALAEMQKLNIIVDLSHSSEQVVREVVSVSKKPIVISHISFNGHCPSPRNIIDQSMQEIV